MCALGVMTVSWVMGGGAKKAASADMLGWVEVLFAAAVAAEVVVVVVGAMAASVVSLGL